MKRLFVILCFVATVVNIQAGDPVKEYGQLQVRGTQLCDQQGRPIVLRGVSLGWHNLWPRFYNAKAVKWLKQDWHPTVIRSAMGIMIEDNYLENPEFALSCMEPVIKACIKENLYVIVDWHSHKLVTEDAKRFFTMIARKYGQHPNIIYELYNEPIEDSWADLKTYCREVASAIREIDPDNIILMGCPHWDQDIHLVAESPVEGISNLMYTVHFYAATHKQWLRDRTADAIRQGVPVFVSECAGMEASGDGPLDPVEWQAWVDFMNGQGISFCCWSLSDKNETCSMLLPRAKSTGQWTDDLIKPWGRMTRETLATGR